MRNDISSAKAWLGLAQAYLIPTSYINPVFAERGRKWPPPWTLLAHGFFLAPLP